MEKGHAPAFFEANTGTTSIGKLPVNNRRRCEMTRRRGEGRLRKGEMEESMQMRKERGGWERMAVVRVD